MKIFSLALMIATSHALADTPAITLHSTAQQQPPKITLHSAYDFKREVSLKVNPDPAFMPADILLKTLSRFELFDARGARITSGFDIDPTSKVVIGFSGGSSEIIKASQSASGITLLASFKDASGNFISPPQDQVAVYNSQGQKLCFDYKSISQTQQKMRFVLLLDRSASMWSVMDDVKASANLFLKSLPPSAGCAVASFNHGFTYHNKHFQSCNLGDFKLDGMVAEGGTDLLVPLLRAHESLGRAEFADFQKAVIVITDGQITQNPVMQQAVLEAKKDTLSFMYLRGKASNAHIKVLADGYIHDPANFKDSLAEYFESLSDGYNTQKLLEIKPCAGGSLCERREACAISYLPR